jgi:hypothetical protein
MKTIWRLCLLGLVLAAGGFGVWAVEPPPARTTGKVLVLDNGNILEGNIELHGEQYRIERATGEVWVPAGKGMRLCADWQEAFAVMTSQANLLDPDEHMRLARWCQLHNLRELALSEATTVLQFQPAHQEAKHLKENLERVLAAENAPAILPSLVSKTTAVAKMDISSASVALFATRVQPILMNTCVSCHAGGKGGNFQLVRSCEGGQRAATQRNLAAVLEQIDVQRPKVSPLLIRSVSPHGSNKLPPIRSHSVPFNTLESWVEQLLRDNPQLRGEKEATELAKSMIPEARVIPASAPSKKELAEQPRVVPNYVSETKPTTPELENRSVPTFTTPPSPVSARQTGARVANEVVAAKHTWSVENKTTAPEASPPASGLVQTAFSDAGTAAAAGPVDEFDPAYFNQQAAKEAKVAGPGR